MKGRRALHVIIATLALIIGLALVALTALLVLPDGDKLLGDLLNIRTGVETLTTQLAARLAFLQGLEFLVPCAIFALPGLLCLLGSIMLYSKYRGKQAKYGVGITFALIGLIIVTAAVVMFGNTLLGQNAMLGMIACGGATAFILLLAIIAKCIKVAPKAQPVEQPAEQPAISQEVAVPAEQPIVATEVTEQPAEQPAEPAYVPQAEDSVKKVVEQTYEKPVEKLDSDAIGKIRKLRALYETHAITKEEYIKLINVYLKK